jgi:hypothetical protein
MATKVVITKADNTPKPTVKHASRSVTHKSSGKSILKTSKIVAASNPSKSPPTKKSMRKHTIRILTDKGYRRHRKTLRKKISKMPDHKVRQLAEKNGLLKNPNTPTPVLRQMVESGVTAGFLSLG